MIPGRHGYLLTSLNLIHDHAPIALTSPRLPLSPTHVYRRLPLPLLFSYHVTISNESDRVVQLQSRHWVIRDSNGKTEEVRGPGVIGVKPILLPGR